MFLKLLTAKGPFRDQEHIKAWLIRVTLHEAVNLHRQFWHRKVGLLGESPFPPEAVAPESSTWEVLETLRTLPGTCSTCTAWKAIPWRRRQRFWGYARAP